MASRSGFSLIEVMVSMVILSAGVLAMGASTGYMLTQVRSAELRGERNVAVREVAQQLRSVDWANAESACANSYSVGDYTVTCSVTTPSLHQKKVEIVSVGPGFSRGAVNLSVADTTAIVLSEPVYP